LKNAEPIQVPLYALHRSIQLPKFGVVT